MSRINSINAIPYSINATPYIATIYLILKQFINTRFLVYEVCFKDKDRFLDLSYHVVDREVTLAFSRRIYR